MPEPARAPGRLLQSAADRCEQLLDFIEKERLNLLAVSAIVFLIIVIRTWMEGSFSPHWGWEPVTTLSVMAFYLPQFLGMVFLLRLFTGERIRRLLNLSIWGFFIILFPPVYDFVLMGRAENYGYIPGHMLQEFITSFYLRFPSQFPHQMGDGMVIQFIAIFALATFYVLVKTRSVLRAALFFGVFYFLAPLLVTPDVSPLLGTVSEYSFFRGISARRALATVRLFQYVLSTVLVGLLTVLLVWKRRVLSLLRSASLPPTGHFMLMTFIGVIVSGEIGLSGLAGLPISPQLAMVGMALLAVFFIQQYAVWINHVYDLDIDRVVHRERALPSGIMDVATARQLAVLFAVAAVGMSFTAGWPAVIVVCCIVLGTIYSAPPLRLRTSILASMFVGAGSSLVFLYGALLPSPANLSYTGYFNTYVPAVSWDVIALAVLIFAVFSVAPLIRQLKDVEGDRRAGVRTIFTVYGRERGIQIAAILVFLSFLSPVLLFHQWWDVMLFAAAAAGGALLFKKMQRAWPVFALYFPVLIYCVARWLTS